MLCAALPCLTTAAEDGPLRNMLRERIAERVGQSVTPQPAERLSGGEKIPGPGRYEIHLQLGGRDRMALVHVPRSYDASQAVPLVVAIHGAGGGAIYQADDSKYGLITKSEQAGFIAVFPNGISRGGQRHARHLERRQLLRKGA